MSQREIETLIRYEEAEGVHTYHLCPYCKKNGTRSGKCAECLRKELKEEEDGE